MTNYGLHNVLHTCYSLQAPVFMAPGAPILFRSTWGMRAALVPPLTSDWVRAVADALTSMSVFSGRFGGIVKGEVRNWKTRYYFGIIGENEPLAIVAGHVSDDAPAGPPTKSEIDPKMGDLQVGQILRYAEKIRAREVVLAPECPPLLLSRWGIHAIPANAVTCDDLTRSVRRMTEAPGLTEEENGIHSFDISLSNEVYFRTAIYGFPTPSLAVYFRLPDGGPSRAANIA